MGSLKITALTLLVTTFICFGQETLDPAKYLRVSRKLDEFCDRRFSDQDDSIIGNYSNCYAGAINSDKEVVKNCRLAVFKSSKVLKVADCSQSMTPEMTMVKDCIIKKMVQKDRNFKWQDMTEKGRKELYDCLDQVFSNQQQQ